MDWLARLHPAAAQGAAAARPVLAPRFAAPPDPRRFSSGAAQLPGAAGRSEGLARPLGLADPPTGDQPEAHSGGDARALHAFTPPPAGPTTDPSTAPSVGPTPTVHVPWQRPGQPASTNPGTAIPTSPPPEVLPHRLGSPAEPTLPPGGPSPWLGGLPAAFGSPISPWRTTQGPAAGPRADDAAPSRTARTVAATAALRPPAGPGRSAATGHSLSTAPAPQVTVHIQRLEVRLPGPPAPRAAPSPRPAAPGSVSLTDYLRGRRKEGTA